VTYKATVTFLFHTENPEPWRVAESWANTLCKHDDLHDVRLVKVEGRRRCSECSGNADRLQKELKPGARP